MAKIRSESFTRGVPSSAILSLFAVLPSVINTASKQRSVLKVGQRVRIEVSETITAVELLHIIIATENNGSIIVPIKELNNTHITIIGERTGQ